MYVFIFRLGGEVQSKVWVGFFFFFLFFVTNSDRIDVLFSIPMFLCIMFHACEVHISRTLQIQEFICVCVVQ